MLSFALNLHFASSFLSRWHCNKVQLKTCDNEKSIENTRDNEKCIRVWNGLLWFCAIEKSLCAHKKKHISVKFRRKEISKLKLSDLKLHIEWISRPRIKPKEGIFVIPENAIERQIDFCDFPLEVLETSRTTREEGKKWNLSSFQLFSHRRISFGKNSFRR